MEENEFSNKMERLKKPVVQAEAAQRQIRLALLNTRKSAWWGFWVLVVPIIFLGANVIKELFNWHWGVTDNIIEWFAKLDQQRSTGWLTPVLFVLLPLVGAVINLLAILHFVYDKVAREIIVTIKLRWINIILVMISMLIVAFVLFYAVTENAHHRAVEQYFNEGNK